MEIVANTGRELLLAATNHVLENGHTIGPRGMQTREVTHARLVLENPRDAFPDGIGRAKLSPALAAAEAAAIVGGVAIPELLVDIAPFYKNFVNSTGGLDGAYGPRIARQMPAIVRRLKRDTATRQAVAVIWREADAARFGTNDLPCTVNLHFMIRDGKLDMHTTMRSNDVWLGVPYDVFMFTALQCTLAGVLDVEVGRYVHDSHSLHIYERNVEDARKLHEPDFKVEHQPASTNFNPGWSGEWRHASELARQILSGFADREVWDTYLVQDQPHIHTTKWHTQALAGYVETPPRATTEKGFWANVNHSADADECWLWMARHTESGHGTFTAKGGGTAYSHRVAFQYASGSEPDGQVRHICGMPACCNPNHLTTDSVRASWANGQSLEERQRQAHNEIWSDYFERVYTSG